MAAHKASLSITNSRSLLKLMSIQSVMPSSHLIFCRPLRLLPPIPSSIRVFYNESTICMWWPKYWSLSFSISPSNEHPGLISFRMDWMDHLTCLLRNLYAGQEATVKTGHGTTGSKSGKEYIKAVYCHLAYLTYMKRTS